MVDVCRTIAIVQALIFLLYLITFLGYESLDGRFISNTVIP